MDAIKNLAHVIGVKQYLLKDESFRYYSNQIQIVIANTYMTTNNILAKLTML